MKLIEQKKFWIFDMDGTLTIALHDFQAIKFELGLPPNEDILSSLSKLSPIEQIKKHTQLNKIELEIAKRAVESPGTSKLLNELSLKSYTMGILTRNSFQNSLETLKGANLIHFFEPNFIFCREKAIPKPNPDGIFQLMKVWDAKKENTIIVGDYRFDLEAGRAAGIDTIYIDPTGEFPYKNLADHSVKSLDSILEI
ncbi:HAD hydrolase-like protein [Leptospira sp. 96542]|nr:HAD hydrolase-like protein [Leptospira sp. 96542]